MELLRFDLQKHERILLPFSVGIGISVWIYSFWLSQNDKAKIGNKGGTVKEGYEEIFGMGRSPVSPRSRAAFGKLVCRCEFIEATDECKMIIGNNRKLNSEEIETDTDVSSCLSSGSVSASSSASSISLTEITTVN